jgi:glycosyltransferase involved in cell wall biosynthesis
MKLLLVADQYYPPTLGGSAITIRRLAHGLAERGHDVTILAPGTQGLRNYVERDGQTTVVRARAVPALHLATNTNKDSAPRLTILPESLVEHTIESLRPDLVQLVTPTIMGSAALKNARRLGIPVVASNHGIPDNLIPFKVDRDWLAYKIFDNVYWSEVISFLNQVDFVTAPTNLACDMLTERGLDKQPVPVSNGVDLNVFCPPAPGEKERLKARFKLPGDRPIVLYAGRLALEKRLDVLLDAMPKVLEATQCHFLFMGAGALDVKGMVAGLGLSAHATFTGLVDDQALPLVFRAADMLVLPSEAELQGMVLLEGAASGLPLIGANALAIPEIVHHGSNGFLHQPGSADDLAERIIALVDNDEMRAKFGQRSVELVQHHALDACIGQMESIYFEVIAQHRGATIE